MAPMTGYNYSLENSIGWLAARELWVAGYEELTSVARQPSLAARRQALQGLEAFKSVEDWSEGWSARIFKHECELFLEALPPTQPHSDQQYLVDSIWLERYLMDLRLAVRTWFLETETEKTSQAVAAYIQVAVAERDASLHLEETAAQVLEESRNYSTLLEVEQLLDRIGWLVLYRHYSSSASKEVQQLVLLQGITTWLQQAARSQQLGRPLPVWEEWFPAYSEKTAIESYEELWERAWQSLAGESEWVLHTTLPLTVTQVTTPEEVERVTVVATSSFLNNYPAPDAALVAAHRHLTKTKHMTQLADWIVSAALPSFERVIERSHPYDI